MMFPTLFAMGDAPTIAMERGLKKALSSFSGETIMSGEACGTFKLRQVETSQIRRQRMPTIFVGLRLLSDAYPTYDALSSR